MEIKGYKGFKSGLICRGKQYAENTTFEEPNADICRSGMHFCQNPIDVLGYYPLVNDNGDFNEFAEVVADGNIKTRDNKSCATKLYIGAKLSFGGFIKACVDFIIEKTKPESSSSEDYAQIGSSEDYAQIGSSEDYAQIGSSGDYARIGSSGDYARIGSSGDYAQIGSSGDYAQIGSSEDYAQIGSSGDYAQIGSSGDYAQIGSSGDSARIGSSGDSAQIGSSGDYAQIGSSGDYAQIGSSGEHSVICCAGNNSRIKAKIGSWITLAEWKQYDDEYIPVCVRTEKVDGEKIKEDVWYMLKDGEFVEVQNV